MNESGKKRIEIGIIVIFLIFGAFRIWQSKAKSGRPALMPKAAGVGAFNLDEAKKKFDHLIEASKEKREHLIERGRDIFQKPAGVAAIEKKALYGGAENGQGLEKTRQELILDGIIWGGDKNMAIISGHVVREGDIIDNAKVLNITSDKVVLSIEGSEIELKR
jgi:hypothetical protein